METKKHLISIIGQCYNEEEALPMFYEAICRQMDKMDYVDFELIFVDDCSKDRSLEIIQKLAMQDQRVHYISMSRNFGREACAMAGFRYASGDYITTMDLDLQDPPELLEDMYRAICYEGYDIAAAKAVTRNGYSFFHRICIGLFYGISNRISTVQMVDGQREYRLMKRQVVNELLKYKEYHLFNKGLLNDVGFRIKWIEYTNIERKIGSTKFPYGRMIRYAVTGLMDYSVIPLVAIFVSGAVFSVLSLLLAIVFLKEILTSFLGGGRAITDLFICLTGAGLWLSLGIMALYLSQIHREVKRRPRYHIRITDMIEEEDVL